MFIKQDHAFNAAGRNGGIHPMSFERHLVANLLVSVYDGVLREPLPERLQHLVREIAAREQNLMGR